MYITRSALLHDQELHLGVAAAAVSDSLAECNYLYRYDEGRHVAEYQILCKNKRFKTSRYVHDMYVYIYKLFFSYCIRSVTAFFDYIIIIV